MIETRKGSTILKTVVKRVDPILGSPAGVSGFTILGDGRVIHILDAMGLVADQSVGRSFNAER